MRLFRAAALGAFAVVFGAIVYATVVPIALRPNTGHVHYERMLAFFALGGSLGAAFPKRWPWVLLGVVVIACGLEYLQTFIPSRDGRLPDALEKCAGGSLGASAGFVVAACEEHFFPHRE